MAIVDPASQVGTMLRTWRSRRRLSQLDVALGAQTSARHLSFIETGRSKPGRELLIRVLNLLDVPARDQNHLLLAAGHAPAFPERSLEHSPDLAPVRQALNQILERHDPYPAIVVDRHWDLLDANTSMLRLIGDLDVDPELLKPPVNALRLGLHPRGLAPLLVNPYQWKRHFIQRLQHQVASTADGRLLDLIEEINSYPLPQHPAAGSDNGALARESELLGPLMFRGPNGEVLSFFGMFATFDTPFELTVSELAIELLFPSDTATAESLGLPSGGSPNSALA